MLCLNPLALLALGILGTLAAADDKPCTAHDKEGRYYDLNPLKSNKDYEFKTPDGRLFVINICGNIKHETHGLKVDKPGDIAGFVRKDHSDFSIGAVNTSLTIHDSHPRLTFTNGSQCKSKSGTTGDATASTAVEFICDTSVFGAGQPRLVAQLPPDDEEAACAYVLEWRTHFACPTGERGGPWGFFAILAMMFLVLLMAYTVLGTIYNRFVLNLRGFDQIPQFSIESMKYHLSEAVNWFRDITSGLYEGSRRAGHSTSLPSFSHNFPGINRSRSSDANPVSHHAQAQAENGGGFVRPQRGPRADINPFSHQSQVHAQARSPTVQSPPPPPPPPKNDAPKRFGAEAQGATREEREFMLGDDDEDEGEEMDIVVRKHVPSESPPPVVATQSSPTAGAPGEEQGQEISAAALRGRDLGDGSVIRL